MLSKTFIKKSNNRPKSHFSTHSQLSFINKRFITNVEQNQLLKDKLQEILTKPINLREESIFRYTADVEDNIRVNIYPGFKNKNTIIYVLLNSEQYVCQEIESLWLENWFVKE